MKVHRQAVRVHLVSRSVDLLQLLRHQDLGAFRPTGGAADPVGNVVRGRELPAQSVEEGQRSRHDRHGGAHILQEHRRRPADEGPDEGAILGPVAQQRKHHRTALTVAHVAHLLAARLLLDVVNDGRHVELGHLLEGELPELGIPRAVRGVLHWDAVAAQIGHPHVVPTGEEKGEAKVVAVLWLARGKLFGGDEEVGGGGDQSVLHDDRLSRLAVGGRVGEVIRDDPVHGENVAILGLDGVLLKVETTWFNQLGKVKQFVRVKLRRNSQLEGGPVGGQTAVGSVQVAARAGFHRRPMTWFCHLCFFVVVLTCLSVGEKECVQSVKRRQCLDDWLIIKLLISVH